MSFIFQRTLTFENSQVLTEWFPIESLHNYLQYEYSEMKMRCYLWMDCCPSTAANAATSAL